MKLIVGLGNPGKEYQNTRHNVGFNVINKYLENNNLTLDKNKFNGLFTKTKIKNEEVVFLEPQKYMNLSGEVVKAIMDFYKIDVSDLLVIHDDLDLPVGKIKLKQNSSSGGHNGIKDIEKNIGSKNYKRIKIGIGNEKNANTKNYVLGKFNNEESKILFESIDKTCDIIDAYFTCSFEELMNKYN